MRINDFHENLMKYTSLLRVPVNLTQNNMLGKFIMEPHICACEVVFELDGEALPRWEHSVHPGDQRRAGPSRTPFFSNLLSIRLLASIRRIVFSEVTAVYVRTQHLEFPEPRVCLLLCCSSAFGFLHRIRMCPRSLVDVCARGCEGVTGRLKHLSDER